MKNTGVHLFGTQLELEQAAIENCFWLYRKDDSEEGHIERYNLLLDWADQDPETLRTHQYTNFDPEATDDARALMYIAFGIPGFPVNVSAPKHPEDFGWEEPSEDEIHITASRLTNPTDTPEKRYQSLVDRANEFVYMMAEDESSGLETFRPDVELHRVLTYSVSAMYQYRLRLTHDVKHWSDLGRTFLDGATDYIGERFSLYALLSRNWGVEKADAPNVFEKLDGQMFERELKKMGDFRDEFMKVMQYFDSQTDPFIKRASGPTQVLGSILGKFPLEFAHYDPETEPPEEWTA